MAVTWDVLLGVFRVALFGLTHFYGGHLAPAIISFSILARVALLPLTVRLALRGRAHARKVKALQPEVVRVRERWKHDRGRLLEETSAVYRRHGVSPVDPGSLKGMVLQTPIFIGIFHAVKAALSSRSGTQAFLWVANLARPDVGVAVLAASLVGMSALAGAADGQPKWALAMPAATTALMAMTLSAGFGLYLAANGVVGTLQALLIRRIEGIPAGSGRSRPTLP